MVGIRHAFVNPKADGGDATIVRPSNWNADHVIPAGVLIDRHYVEYTTYSSSGTTLPFDNTIPLNTEGVEIISTTFAPKTTTNRLRSTVVFPSGLNASSAVQVAMFINGTCVRATSHHASSGWTSNMMMIHEYVPGTTSSLTYAVRFGPGAGASAYVNGQDTTRIFGGVQAATLLLEEFVA
jgi:hypothetical protein